MSDAPSLRVELVPADPDWSKLAARESKRIRDALGDVIVAVHHIGSTAIPKIAAKPIIDLIPVVRSLVEIDEQKYAIEALGYHWRGEFGIAERRFCVLNDRESGRRIAHIHMFEQGSHQIARHLLFRDYLRAHPEEVRAYEAEKCRAQALHPDDSQAYNNAKSAWIYGCNFRAAAWAKQNQ